MLDITPKEKAKELIDKFELIQREKDYQDEFNLFEAKQCALICVNEILDIVMQQFGDIEGTCYGIDNYWENVKKEIELC